ncbi:MAG: hypothetical protein LBM27_04930 [Lactobacillaceae bacterium]|jgi:hypothetical protein|nr:hypothetical protein [Lactobacillaceae bacterium]
MTDLLYILKERDWTFEINGVVEKRGLYFADNNRIISGDQKITNNYRLTEDNLLIYDDQHHLTFALELDLNNEERTVFKGEDVKNNEPVLLSSTSDYLREPDFRFGNKIGVEELTRYNWVFGVNKSIYIDREVRFLADGRIAKSREDISLSRWEIKDQNLRLMDDAGIILTSLKLQSNNANGIVFVGIQDGNPRILTANPYDFVDGSNLDEMPLSKKASHQIILASYFFEKESDDDFQKLVEVTKKLVGSARDRNIEIVIISNAKNINDLKTDFTFEYFGTERFKGLASSYWYRWISEYQYLLSHPEISALFALDAGDTEVLNNPFGEISDDILYVGSELNHLTEPWTSHVSRDHAFYDWYKSVDAWNMQLLNTGVFGGYRSVVLELLGAMNIYWSFNRLDEYQKNDVYTGAYDMSYFNLIVYKYFLGRVSFGPKVNTRFKHDERTDAWFKHK